MQKRCAFNDMVSEKKTIKIQIYSLIVLPQRVQDSSIIVVNI